MNIKKTKSVLNLLNLISEKEIKKYVDRYNADFSTNKLHTIIFLKLFLYCWMLDQTNVSLGNISNSSKNKVFKNLTGIEEKFSIAKNSLSDRLTNIPDELFKELFEKIAQEGLSKYQKKANSANLKKLIAKSRVLDSTIITLSSKLLKAGYYINEGQLTIKSSMAINGRQIPVKALVLFEKTYSSEDRALPKVIDLKSKDTIYIFDRGIQKLETYNDIAKSNNYFISRLSAKNYKIIKESKITKKQETETVEIIKDEIIKFEQIKDKEQKFRLITAISKKNAEELKFITNLKNVTAKEISELYRYRWSIEIFFRFLKSNLHLESLLSYNENGIKVHIYLTLIAFIITWLYKEQNNITSFKRARESLKWNLLEIFMQKQFYAGFLAAHLTKTPFMDSS